MIIDCISDLHGFFPKLDGGDLLIIAGDLTKSDRLDEYEKFDAWLRDQQYRKKVIVAGNHDNHLQNGYKIKYGDYLEDSATEFEGFKIWGSPWTKRFEGQNPMCMAFSYPLEDDLKCKFDLIPDYIDILVTHSPPYAIMDTVDDHDSCANYHVGSWALGNYIQEFKPKLHVFGHIHECYGCDEDEWNLGPKTTKYINASHVNEWYEPVNPPIRIEL